MFEDLARITEIMNKPIELPPPPVFILPPTFTLDTDKPPSIVDIMKGMNLKQTTDGAQTMQNQDDETENAEDAEEDMPETIRGLELGDLLTPTNKNNPGTIVSSALGDPSLNDDYRPVGIPGSNVRVFDKNFNFAEAFAQYKSDHDKYRGKVLTVQAAAVVAAFTVAVFAYNRFRGRRTYE
jgi:hypothetical protein